MRRGILISLEGGEGGGKSTQARILAERLELAGRSVCLTREPGGSPGGEAIRSLLVEGEADRWSATSEALLMNAARRDHLERVIRPKLAQGLVVISDRFADSTRAYQGQAGGASLALLDALEAAIVEGDWPDLTFVLDIPAEEGLRRAAQRGGAQRFESKGLAFHEALRAAFLAIAEQAPERCRVIDATGSQAGVADAIWAHWLTFEAQHAC